MDQRPEGEVPTRLVGTTPVEVPVATVERRRCRSEGQDPARVREAQKADSGSLSRPQVGVGRRFTGFALLHGSVRMCLQSN